MGKSDPTEVIIDLTGHVFGGDAIGRLPDGRALFVPYSLPGERVRALIKETKRGYARAELLEVIKASPDRIQPRCRHFGVCGGCHYQHMPYQSQLGVKTSILVEQLERIGGLSQPNVAPTIASPHQTAYRNHIEFHLTAEGKLGYNRHRSHETFPLVECFLPEEPLNTIWPLLKFEKKPDLQRIGLRSGSNQEALLILENDNPQPPEINVEDLPVSVVHLSPVGELVLAGNPAVWMDVLDRPFQVSAASFFQTNTQVAELMVKYMLKILPEIASLNKDTFLVEGYCGVGLFSAFLARQVGRLVGIESSSGACEDFVVNLDEFDNVELYEATIENALPALKGHPDIVLVDPPRQGISRPAMDALLGAGAATLVYVSCDAATLARDARRLIQEGYKLYKITPFDQFPQTYHIETISFWTRL